MLQGYRPFLILTKINLNLLLTSSTTTIHTPPTATILLVTSSSAIRPAFELLRLQNPLRLRHFVPLLHFSLQLILRRSAAISYPRVVADLIDGEPLGRVGGEKGVE